MKTVKNIAPAIRRLHPELNDQQLELIGHLTGPMLGIAGPGAGKTLVIVLRAVNLLLLGLVDPAQLLLCTYNRAAARQLRDRFNEAARAAGYEGDARRVSITTLHGLCRRLLRPYPERVGLRPGFRLLNEEEQLDLLSVNFGHIFSDDLRHLTRRGWRRRHSLLRNALKYFDRICDELIDPWELADSGSRFVGALGRCHLRYENLLLERNLADFAHLQRWTVELMQEHDDVVAAVSADVRHLMCDEYQDTSYAQERLLFELTRTHGNLCVVGDEDQSLYRFRGASVENILRFPERVGDCRVVELTVNYRSHPRIVRAYADWMASVDWGGGESELAAFRHDKTITAGHDLQYDDYPAVLAVKGNGSDDEIRQLVQMLRFLKRGRVISRYSQVALLLHSVREEVAGPYIDGLEEGGIPVRCAPDFSRPMGRSRDRASGAVSITTIHQSKGLEWDVVIVGSLDFRNRDVDPLGRVLMPHTARPAFEPESRINLFDHMRQHYVAFSRARHLLVLTASNQPKIRFDTLWERLPRWHELDRKELSALVSQNFGCAETDAAPPFSELALSANQKLLSLRPKRLVIHMGRSRKTRSTLKGSTRC